MNQKSKVQSLAFCLLTFIVTGTLIFSCGSNNDKSANENSPEKEHSIKYTQYYIKGEQLYLTHCSNCHQKNGAGLGLLFPPLNGSDYLHEHADDVICLIRNGIKGEIVVNGKHFNKEMKGIPSLTDLEIAEIATYIYNTWGENHGIIEVTRASAVLSGCKTGEEK
jgi:cytochrome c551